MNEAMTPFQLKCEQRLIVALANVGRDLLDRRIEGINESYIHARISDSKIEVWIYEDEAMISGEGLDLRFESPDYPAEDKLIDALIGAITAELRRNT